MDSQTFDAMIAERFLAIKDTITNKTGDYVYGWSRTQPSNLGWRFRQNILRHLPLSAEVVEMVRSGRYDKGIEETYHEAASAEHWYRYEKDYG